MSLRGRVGRLERLSPPGRCAACRGVPDEWTVLPTQPDPEPCPACGFLPRLRRVAEVVVGFARDHPGAPTAAEALSAEEFAALGLPAGRRPEDIAILGRRS